MKKPLVKEKNHIYSLEQLRQNIGFRSYAGKDPRLEYKRESFEMFQVLLENIKFESIRYLSIVKVSSNANTLSKPESKKLVSKHADAPSLFDSKNIEGFPTIRLEYGNKEAEYDARPDAAHLEQFVNEYLQ